jgi:predicted Zn-dependent peptidase
MDELGARIEQVTADEVQRTAQDFFDQRHVALAVLGNLDGVQVSREDLIC